MARRAPPGAGSKPKNARGRRLFVLLGDGHALAFKAHRLTGDDFAAFAGFHRAVDFYQPVGNGDFRLRAAFAPAFQLQQIAQLNVRVFA
jgi:hypothetical protein